MNIKHSSVAHWAPFCELNKQSTRLFNQFESSIQERHTSGKRILLLLALVLCSCCLPLTAQITITRGNGLLVNIPDNNTNGASATVSFNDIPTIATLTNIEVSLGFNHEFVGDLKIELSTPTGDAIVLVDRPSRVFPDETVYSTSNLLADHEINFADRYTNDPELMGVTLFSSEVVCEEDNICDFYPNDDTSNPKKFADVVNEVNSGAGPKGEWVVTVSDLASGTVGNFIVRSISLTYTVPPSSPILHVDAGAAIGGDGSTWNKAFKYLQDALAVARFYDNVEEIWVAEGRYYPDKAEFADVVEGSREESFYLVKDVTLLGGFAGTETSSTERNHVTYVTTLSGNISNGSGGASYHVIRSESTLDQTAILDGFTVTEGYADGNNENAYGGGIHNSGSPTYRNIIIDDNFAFYGAGIYNINSQSNFRGILINNGYAAGAGSGIYNSSSSITITNSFINNNISETRGGGVFNSNSSPIITNVVFRSNSAGAGFLNNQGGAIHNAGSSSPLIINASFYDNWASRATSIYNAPGASPIIVNSVFYETRTPDLNSDTEGPIVGGTPTFKNCYFNFESLPEGSTDGDNNLLNQPNPFIDVNSNNLQLKAFSRAIDAGDNSENSITEDLAGNSRKFDDIDVDNIGGGDSPIIDMGAYERQIRSCSTDLDNDGVCDDIDQELNSPCPDEVDANGVSQDDDQDGTPNCEDECPGIDDTLLPLDAGAIGFGDGSTALTGCAGAPPMFSIVETSSPTVNNGVNNFIYILIPGGEDQMLETNLFGLELDFDSPAPLGTYTIWYITAGDNFEVETPGVFTGCYALSDPITIDIVEECNLAPIAVCQDISINTGDDCQATITAVQLDGGSSDPEGDELTFSVNNEGPFAAGDHVLTLTVDDGSQSSTCTATLTLQDNKPPTASCQALTVQLNDNGLASISATAIDNGSNDACGIANLSLDKANFDCTNVGDNTVTLTATDVNTNSSSCTTTVTVIDETAPTASCQNISIDLDATGNASISTDQINNGSYDDCGIASMSLDQTTFTCDQVRMVNNVTLSVTDNNGNTNSCEAQVIVGDGMAPIASCRNVTLQLEPDGTAILSPQQIDNGSSDGCGIATMSLDQTNFNCDQTGEITVTLSVIGNNQNSSNCQAIVTVMDEIAPILTCPADLTVHTDQGECGAYVTLPKAVASDNCGLSSLRSRYRPIDENEDPIGDFSAWADDHSGFFETGSFEIQWEAGDGANNYSYCVMILDVIDEEAPAANCQDITLQLDENGLTSIAVNDINNGSSDACGLANLSLDKADFDCSNTGENTVTLSATDLNGNSSSCQATVTVEDDTKPTLTCPADLTVNTDQEECGAYVTLPKAAPADICGIKNLKSRYRTVDEQGNPSGSWSAWASDHSGFFELGAYQIQWRAKDDSNNKGFCSYQLNIIDEEAPEVICTDVTIQFNGEATIAIDPASIFDAAASFDACGPISLVSQSLEAVSCDNIGQSLSVQVIGADPNGNTSSCSAQVSVEGMPCGFEASDIDCENGAAADYNPVEESFTLTANDCSGYPQGEYAVVTTELCSDGEIIAQISSLSGDGRAGLFMMESADPEARFVNIVKDLTPRVRTEYRSATGGSISNKRKNRSGVDWLRIVRDGSKFKTYTSINGSYWRLAHTINFPNFDDCIQVGLLVYTKNSNGPISAVFENVKVVGDAPSALEQININPATALQITDEQQILTDQGVGIDVNVAPNPFADQTQIEFTLPKASDVTLEIYNLHGQRVQSLENALLNAGTHRYQWNGQSSQGESLPTGIYMLRLRANKKWFTTKVSLINR